LNKQRKQARKDAGLCTHCGKPVVPGKTVCEYHLIYASKQSRQLQDERRAKGLCPYCGKESIPGSKQCEDCRKRHLASRRRNNCNGNWIPTVERDGWMCRICGGLKQLCVHHIDGQGNDSEYPNHDLDNLITLCKPCHNNITKLRHHAKDKQLVAELVLA
jgi:5-methylcytosine-specific restriction endonuclease McrA